MIRYTGTVSVVKRTSLGHPFRVYKEEPEMPRIDDRFLDCSIYLYSTESDAKHGRRVGGSGFLVAIRGSVSNGPGIGPVTGAPYHLYAVSNRHVVEDHPVVRLNTHDGKVDIIPFQTADWTFTKEQDIALIP